MKTEIKVVDCNTAKELEKEINILLKDGWKLRGNIAIGYAQTDNNFTAGYVQMMYK